MNIIRLWRVILISSLLLSAIITPGAQQAAAQDNIDAPVSTPLILVPERVDRSPELAAMAPAPLPDGETTELAPPVSEIPSHLPPRTLDPQAIPSLDPVVQRSFGPGLMPPTGFNFEGIRNTENSLLILPPDTQGDIGPNHYVQWVNLSFAVWQIDRSAGTATRLLGPLPGNALWQGFGGACETSNDGDPITLYDPLSDRWLMSQFALAEQNHQCIAISATADPTGAWYRYDYNWGAKMNDYPKFGVWSDGYYLSVNQFLGDSWAGAGVAVFERAQMLQGLTARMVLFDLLAVDDTLGGMLPSDLDGPPPPAGAPNLFAQFDDDAWNYTNEDLLRFFAFHVDWANPAASTFTPAATLNLTDLGYPFDSQICNALRGRCIPQPGTTFQLEDLADRLMHRMAYRNFGDHQSLVISHTVDAASQPGSTPGVAGVRWYEVRLPGGVPTLHQAGTYSPDSTHRWMGSAAMDRQGNIAVGYSAASSSLYPSIRYTGRLAGDPPGTLPQGEATIITGGGSQLSASPRWGDYSMLAIDPVDDCTFWYTQEYYSATSLANWQTRIASFRFPSCTSAPLGSLQGVVSDILTLAPIPSAEVRAGEYATWTDSNGVYRFASLPAGVYELRVSAFGYPEVIIPGVVISEGQLTVQNVSLSATPLVEVTGVVQDATPGGHAWALYAQIDIAGYPASPIFTDPSSGTFSVNLPAGTPFTFTVQAVAPGYTPITRQVTPSEGAPAEVFGLQADLTTCTAPGYYRPGFFEGFDLEVPPSLWQVTDTPGSGVVWKTSAEWLTDNWTGGAGYAAAVDSDAAGALAFDTALVSPPFTVAELASPVLEFRANYQNYDNRDRLDVDFSADGGAWVNLLRWTTDHGAFQSLPGEQVSLDLSPYLAGVTSFRLRWRYYDPLGVPPLGDWYVQVDEIRLQGACAALPPGGLLLGYARDANTTLPLPGARITGPAGSSAARTPDGFYQLYAPSGVQSFSAALPGGYGTQEESLSITADAVTRFDFALQAPLVSAEPAEFGLQLLPGQVAARTMNLANTGALAANVQVYELNAPYRPVESGAHFAQPGRGTSPKRLNDLSGSAIYYTFPAATQVPAAGELIDSWVSPLAYSWGIGYNQATNDLWLSSPLPGGGDGRNHRLSPAGADSGDTIDTRPLGGIYQADLAYNPFSGMFWQVNVGGDNCIYELNPTLKIVTGVKICPAFDSSQRGLAYNPLDDTFYSGSWNDGILYHFDARGAILESYNTGLAIAGLAFNPDTGRLFALINAPGVTTASDVYVLDAYHQFAILGSFNLGGSYSHRWGGGLEFDCTGALWAVDTLANAVFHVLSGDPTACQYRQVPWLSLSPAAGSINPAQTLPVELLFNWAGYIPNAYRATLRIETGSPYGPLFVPLFLQAGYPIALPWLFR